MRRKRDWQIQEPVDVNQRMFEYLNRLWDLGYMGREGEEEKAGSLRLMTGIDKSRRAGICKEKKLWLGCGALDLRDGILPVEMRNLKQPEAICVFLHEGNTATGNSIVVGSKLQTQQLW